MAEPDPAQEKEHARAAFEAVAAADREVLHQLRDEVDELGNSLHREQEEGRHLQDEVSEKTQTLQRLEEEEARGKAAVEAAKERLLAAREHHRSTDLDSFSLGTDRTHVAEELVFLERKMEDDRLTIEGLLQANALLEKHTNELQAQLVGLEKERRAMAGEAAQERELLRQEQRLMGELRNKADRIKREKLAATAQGREAELSEQRLREAKTAGTSSSVAAAAAALAPARSPVLPPPRPPTAAAAPEGGHSWAYSVFSPNVRGGSGLGLAVGGASPGSAATLSPPAESPSRGVPLAIRPPGIDVHF